MYQYKDHLGNVRLSYADCDGDETINPATEILEENNYYPFGLQHQGYNDIANSCRNEEAEAYKFLNKEYEDNFALNVTETDFRHYDSALGRFNVLDPMAELAYDFTPYRYGFNNPVFFSDASGLFETQMEAKEFAADNGFNKYELKYNSSFGGYVLTVIGGEFDGRSFYDFSELLPEVQVSTVGGVGGGSGGGGGNKSGLGAQLSADFTNSYSSSGLKHAVNWWSRNVNFGIYDFLYNTPAVTGYGSGKYGPYTADAEGVSLSIGAWGSSFGVSLVLDKYNNFDWFVSYSGGAGYTGTGFSVGATFDSYNNNSSENSVLNGIAGSTYDVSGGSMVMGTYSTPFDPVIKQIINNGVERYSVGLGSGIRVGEGRTYSSGQIYQNMINYFNSFNK